MAGFKLTTNPVSGYVLKSDAVGVGTWQAGAAGTVTSVSGSGGTTGLTLNGGPITTSGTLTISGTLVVANGGTGGSNALTARANLGAAASGANADITSLTGLTTALSAPQGGTAQTTYATGDLLYASGVNTLAKRTVGAAGTVLTVAGGVPTWATPVAAPVTSVFGRVGAVAATAGDYNTSLVTENAANLYFTNARAQAAITGGASSIVTTNLTANKALLSDALGKVAVSAVTNTELGYVGGVTSALQTQLNAKAPLASPAFTGIVTMAAPLGAGQGGTGITAPGALNNVLTSNGVGAWVSQVPASGVGGSGTTNKIPKFTAASTVGDSQIFDNGSTIGIGTVAPTAGDQMEIADAGGAGGGARLTVSDNGGAVRYYLLLQAPNSLVPYARIQSFRAIFGAQNLILQDSGGNVGIGNVAPAQKLDVSGMVQMTGFRLTTTPTNGYVLKSDAAGVGTWQAGTSGTVTSVSGSGGTTGLTLSGGPITTSGTLTIGGTLAVANGGTGLTAAGTANQILGMNAGATGLEYKTLIAGSNITITPAAGSVTIAAAASGEANTASNVGVGGVGMFKQKTGVNLELKNVNAASGKVSVANDVVNNEVDVDVVESALTLDNIGGTLGVAKGGTGAITAASARTNLGTAASGVNGDITQLSALITPLTVGQGGTNSTTASGARLNLGVAASGANADITSLSGLTTVLSVAQGGTGAATLDANSVLLGNGTSPVTAVAPGASSSMLISNGTTWVRQAPANNVGSGAPGSYQRISIGGLFNNYRTVATCPSGKKVVGGGCWNAVPGVCDLVETYPDTDSSWTCMEYNKSSGAICGYTGAFAICM